MRLYRGEPCLLLLLLLPDLVLVGARMLFTERRFLIDRVAVCETWTDGRSTVRLMNRQNTNSICEEGARGGALRA